MTWKDIKLATMQKMYAAEGSTIPTDESTVDYIAAMPYVANEGIMMICTSKKFLIKSANLTPESGLEIGGYRRYKMSDLVNDFFEFYGEVYYTEGSEHVRSSNYVTEANDVIMIPKSTTGIWTVYYKAYPEEITSTTEDEEVIDIPRDVLAILPLYMASQLYKDDDNGIATSLRNEFEVAYDRLSQDNPSFILEDSGDGGW